MTCLVKVLDVFKLKYTKFYGSYFGLFSLSDSQFFIFSGFFEFFSFFFNFWNFWIFLELEWTGSSQIECCLSRKTDLEQKIELKKFTTIIFYIVHIDWNKAVVMHRTRTVQTIKNQIPNFSFLGAQSALNCEDFEKGGPD